MNWSKLAQAGDRRTTASPDVSSAASFAACSTAPAFSVTLGETVPYEISGTLAAAVEHAAKDAALDTTGEAVVLLSPACASFDQFKNFEIRGEAFRQAVNAIKGVKPIGGTD